MSAQICFSDISEETWRAIITGLKASGWTAQTGGGLDFSWAVVTRNDMRIDMEYDIWCGGEMVFAAIHAAVIRGDLPADVIAELEKA